MARNHHYRYLFGTVSIARDYTNLSRALIVSYLKAQEMEPVLVSEVRAYNPPRKADLKRSESCILPLEMCIRDSNPSCRPCRCRSLRYSSSACILRPAGEKG